MYVKQLQVACEGGPEVEIMIQVKAEAPVNEAKVLRESLKAKAAELGIAYPKNISTPDLEKLIAEKN
jgi:hypothetical protein